MYSVALSGLSFVNALVPGVNTPVCGLSSLRDFWQAPLATIRRNTDGKGLKRKKEKFSPDSNNFLYFLHFCVT